MNVPPYEVVLRALGTTREEAARRTEITVPIKFLQFLLQFALKDSDLNEKAYLAANPDVAAALLKKTVTSAADHYRSSGYFEGRRGTIPDLDEKWYQKANPDVFDAIEKKKLSSASEHYRRQGVDEFRAPNNACQEEWSRWVSLAGKKPKVGV